MAQLTGQHVLVTGAAGFIGMHVARALCDAGARVTGADNLDPYYDVSLKKARLAELAARPAFAFEHADLADAAACERLLSPDTFTSVVHLAAQPGVRYSLVNPDAYVRNNLVAFGHVLERCRHCRIAHLVYASSSSVYGANHDLPFSEDQSVDHPVSLYAATKKANELMAHSYSHLFGLPTTGLRFFTVYGPWGRPDQAPMLFTKAIVEGRPIDVFNRGDMARDFTYIDDVAEGVLRTLERPPRASTAMRRMPSTTSATTRRFRSTRSSGCSKRCLAAARCATSGRCSRGTSRRRTRRSNDCSATPVSRRPRRSPTDWRASWTGTAATIRRLELRVSRCLGGRASSRC